MPVGHDVQPAGRGGVGHRADDRCGVIDVDEIEPRVGISGDWQARLEIGDPRQPVGAIEPGEPQGRAGAGRMGRKQCLGLDEHPTRFAGRIRRCRFIDHAAPFVPPYAGRTREDHPRRRAHGPRCHECVEQPPQSVNVNIAVRGTGGAIEAHAPKDSLGNSSVGEELCPAWLCRGDVDQRGSDATLPQLRRPCLPPRGGDHAKPRVHPPPRHPFAEVAAADHQPKTLGEATGVRGRSMSQGNRCRWVGSVVRSHGGFRREATAAG